MAYAVKYFYQWKNFQNDVFLINILQDGFVGDATELQATGNPLVIAPLAGDSDIYSPIKPLAITIEFWNLNNGDEGDGIPAYNVSIADFYSDTQNAFRVDVYNLIRLQNGEVPINNTPSQLLFSGFLQIDNSQEDLQDYAHPINLQANDNLGQLQNIAYPDPSTTEIYEGITLEAVFKNILLATGLELPLDAYLNIFENSTDDRSVVDTNDFLQQTTIYTNNLILGSKVNQTDPVQILINGGSIYKDCYSILEDILTSFKATLFQANGRWNIVRIGEYRLFTDNAVPGTEYSADFNTLSAITMLPPQTIGPNPNNAPVYPFEPINANQIKRILRPFQFSERTFNYNQPQLIIVQSDLSLEAGAVPFNTFTGTYTPPGGGTGIPAEFNDYGLGTYFPAWKTRTGNTSYLEIVTDTANGNEIERYIVSPGNGVGVHNEGVQFNNIPVTAGDTFDFNVNFRTDVPSTSTFRFWIRILLIYADGVHYGELLNFVPSSPSTVTLVWATNRAIANWDLATGIFVEMTNPSGDDTIANQTFSLSSFLQPNQGLPPIPADGVLLIQINGTDGTAGDQTTYWNNINIEFTHRINNQTNAIGQYHLQTQPLSIKNNENGIINFDDSPRNTIYGTYMITPLVSFGANVGDIYFTKTLRWHRAALTEELRLNQINTFDTLFIQRIARLIVEGDFYGLHYTKEGGFSGNGNIGIDPPIIELTGLPSADGIEPGMLFEYAGYLYTVVSVAYISGIVHITTDPTPTGPDMIGVDYAFYWPQQFISLLTILQMTFFAGKNFLIGIGSFDFRRAQWNATMYELYDTGEVDADLSNTYAFQYLFNTGG